MKQAVVITLILLVMAAPALAQTPEPTVHGVDLPSGATATVTMTATAGEIIVAGAVGFLITLHLWDIARGLVHMVSKR